MGPARSLTGAPGPAAAAPIIAWATAAAIAAGGALAFARRPGAGPALPLDGGAAEKASGTETATR